jgi:hypothetical protein
VNGYVLGDDALASKARKVMKSCLSSGPVLCLLESGVLAAERLGLPDHLLHPAYRFVVGLNYFRGFREGLEEMGGRRSRIVGALRRAGGRE